MDENQPRRSSDAAIATLVSDVAHIKGNVDELKRETKNDISALRGEISSLSKEIDNVMNTLRRELLDAMEKGFGKVNEKTSELDKRVEQLEKKEEARALKESFESKNEDKMEGWVKPIATAVLTAIILGGMFLVWAWLTHWGTMPLATPTPILTPHP